MQALLEHFITQSVMYSLIAVALVAFLESLALVGLILPGTVMAGLGALIGSGEVNFWQAWMAGIIGCLLGDWISFWLGWRFKKPLHRWSFMKKNKALLDKTEHALHQHSMFTILVGRFVGPTRPLVPMVAGMLDLPVAKFVVPNIIGCVFWPPFYFLPGILAGAAIDIPDGMQSGEFKWLLLGTAVLLDGITARIEEELGRPATLVVTGGLAKYVTPLCRHPLTYDPELLLKGLALLYQMNAPQPHYAAGGRRRNPNNNFRRGRRPRSQRRERREEENKNG